MGSGGVDIEGVFLHCVFVFFFFQAEDGIRDLTVTGVQTCALPISDLGERIPTPSAHVDQQRTPIDTALAARKALEFVLRDQARDHLPAAGDAHCTRALRFAYDRGQLLSRRCDRILLLHGQPQIVVWIPILEKPVPDGKRACSDFRWVPDEVNAVTRNAPARLRARLPRSARVSSLRLRTRRAALRAFPAAARRWSRACCRGTPRTPVRRARGQCPDARRAAPGARPSRERLRRWQLSRRSACRA